MTRKRKPVVVKLTAELVRMVPEDWDADRIEFQLNGSGWCASNITDEIDQREELTGKCFCDLAHFEYLRDATEDDRQKWPHLNKTDGE